MTPAPVPSRTVMLLLLGYLAAVLLNLHHIALWCLPLAFGAALWRAKFMRQQTTGRSRRWLRAAVVFALTLAVLIAFHTLNGVQAGATLLVCMAALKLSETRARRDWYIIAAASIFLLLAACLDGQLLWRLPLYAANLYLICLGLYALGAAPATPPLKALLRRTGISLLTAVPFALLLFLFVPRLPGSFWAIPRTDQAITGLSDEMDPGSISELSQSSAAAARVRFTGPVPPAEQRYWRGFVLHSFDGRAWRRGHPRYGAPQPLTVAGEPYRYDVSMEPAPYPMLVALELPDEVPSTIPSARITDDYVLWNPDGVNQAVHYHLNSHPQHRSPQPMSDAERQLDLNSYARNHNLRSIELARTLRAESDSDAAFVQRVLDYLRRGGFRYTLEPPTLGRDSIDDLLFTTHEGFCGHYASAFALLMRAGGVPARVVTGYQGGIWNRYGGYLLIRQSDAHAWTEVWLDGIGWERVDPTAVVSPSRVSGASNAALEADGSLAGFVLHAPWITSTLQAWQAANAWWQDEFVDFDFVRQQNLLGTFGLKHGVLRVLSLLLFAGAAVWLTVVGWSLRSRGDSARADTLRRSWLLIERKLRHAAPPRAAHEGVVDYAARVGQARPEFAGIVTALARRYARLRYGPAAAAHEVEQFHRAARLMRAIRSSTAQTAGGVRTRASSSPPPMKNSSSTRMDRR